MPVDLPPDVLRALGIPDALRGGLPAPDPLPPQIPPVDSALPGLDGEGAPLPVPQPLEVPAPAPSPPAGHDLIPPPAAAGAPAAPSASPSPAPAPAPAPHPAPTPPRPIDPGGRAPTPEQQMARARGLEAQGETLQMQGIADETDAQRQQARDELAAHEAYKGQVADLRKEQARIAAESQKVHDQKAAYVASTLHDAESYKVDQGKYVKDMGLGGMAGWGIAMILSGIGDSLQRKQGPNPVTQMLVDKMRQSVQLQLDERDQLKQRNARAAHDLDKYDAFSKDRIAQTNLLEAKYETQLAKMIQEAALRAKDPLAKANGEKAAGALLVSAAEKGQKAGEAAATNQIAQQQLGVSRGNLAVSQFSARETQRHNLATEGLTGQQRDIEAIKLEREGRNAEAKLVRERAVGGESRLVPVDPNDIKPGDNTITKDGKTYRVAMGLVTDRSGETWKPGGTESVVSEFQKSHEAGLKVLAAIDELRRLGPEWMSDTANSKKLQETRQVISDGVLDMVKFKGLGVPQGKDIENSLGAMGLKNDPTGWKDTMDGMNKARESMVRNMNLSMQARGLDKPWQGPIDPLLAPKAEPSATQKLLTTLMLEPDENSSRAYDKTFTKAYKSNGGDIAKALVEANLAAANAHDGIITTQQKDDLETLKAQAIAGDAAARDALANAAKSAPSERVKELAKQALRDIDEAARPVDPTSSAGPVYDPLGYDPQSLVNRFNRPVTSTLQP